MMRMHLLLQPVIKCKRLKKSPIQQAQTFGEVLPKALHSVHVNVLQNVETVLKNFGVEALAGECSPTFNFVPPHRLKPQCH